MTLYRMSPGACLLNNALKMNPGEAIDFAVSPDGQTVAFAGGAKTGGMPVHDIYVVPTDLAQAPVLFAGDSAADDFGPRWVAGGKQLTWTRIAPSGQGAVMIANADKSGVRVVLEAPAQPSSTLMFGASNAGLSCQAARGSPPIRAALLVALLLLLRRFRAARRSAAAARGCRSAW
jgi:hypothetical protein